MECRWNKEGVEYSIRQGRLAPTPHSLGLHIVGEDRLGSAKGPLGVDDPALAMEGGYHLVEDGSGSVGVAEACEVEATVETEPPEPVEHLSAEQGREDPDGEEEVVVGLVPAAVVVEGTAGDDAMEMGVELELAGPCVEHGGDAEPPAEPPGVCAELEERGSGGTEEHVESEAAVSHHQGPQLSGQSEDEMEVVCGDDALPTLRDPSSLWERLALGAVTVPTGNGELSISNRHLPQPR